MSQEATFVFADIAGFTALTEAHGDDSAADVAGAFRAEVQAIVGDYGAQKLKPIGDAVMIVVPVAAAAVRLGVRIADELMAGHGRPTVRVGMHHGPAVARDGDWYGATVNIAARVAGEAAGAEVLITQSTRQAAGAMEDIALEAVGIRRLRNVREPLRLFAARRRAGREGTLAIDPVCRMAVDPARAAGRLIHDGREYSFCSLECAGAFARDPRAFAGAR